MQSQQVCHNISAIRSEKGLVRERDRKRGRHISIAYVASAILLGGKGRGKQYAHGAVYVLYTFFPAYNEESRGNRKAIEIIIIS